MEFWQRRKRVESLEDADAIRGLGGLEAHAAEMLQFTQQIKTLQENSAEKLHETLEERKIMDVQDMVRASLSKFMQHMKLLEAQHVPAKLESQSQSAELGQVRRPGRRFFRSGGRQSVKAWSGLFKSTFWQWRPEWT